MISATAISRRKHLWQTFVFAAICMGTQAAWSESLKETLALSLAHDARLGSAMQGIRAAELAAASTARSLVPSLNLAAGYQNTPPSSVTVQNNWDMNAGVQWTVFSGFAKTAAIEEKKLQIALAENELSAARTEEALNVIAAYRQAQAAQLQIDILTAARNRAQLQIDQTSALEKQGMAKKIDVLSLTIPRLDYDQKLIAAKADLSNALDLLASITAKQISVDPAPSEDLRPTLASFHEEGLDQLKAFAIQRKILLAGKTLAESKIYPALSLNGALHYGYPGVSTLGNQWSFYATAGATVSWSFNWGGDLLTARQVESNLAGLLMDESSAREKARLQYTRAVRDWRATKDALDVLAATRDLARARLTIVQTQYENGMASTTDFNDANLGLAQSELQYRSQLLSLLLKANQIDALAGNPVDQWSVTP
jgi:outer membrane protein TolC